MENRNLEGGVNTGSTNPNAFSGGSMNGESTDKNVQDAMGHAQSAIGSAKDALGSGVQAANTEIDALKDQIAKLAQTVSQLVQSQASTTRDQVMTAVGSAGELDLEIRFGCERDFDIRRARRGITHQEQSMGSDRDRGALGPAHRQGALVNASSKG